MSVERKLLERGYVIEPADLTTGRFAQAVQSGRLIFTAGQVPVWGDRVIKGKVGGDVSLEEAQEAARLCTLNCLRAVRAIAGSLDRVSRIVKVFGMVNVAPGFDDTPSVINACSDLLNDVFGAAGRHARSAVGMTLPLNYSVEIELVAELADDVAELPPM
jgi:enamine deaminase RidA (YjgF/YER057c/UK114 family)